MQKGLLDGNAVYAFDVQNEYRVINHGFEKVLRRASVSGNLKCVDCGATLIFKFGKMNIPHFAHKNLEEAESRGCSYSKETEEHIEGKKLLMDYMRSLYPKAMVEQRYYLKEINRYSDIFIRFQDGQELAIEFQRIDTGIEYYESKKKDYEKITLNNIWIVGNNDFSSLKQRREFELNFSERLVLNDKNKVLICLDTIEKKIILKSKMVYIDKLQNKTIMDSLFQKSYDLNKVKILPDGSIDCDFFNHYRKELSRFHKEQENIHKRTNLPKVFNNKFNGNFHIEKDSRKADKYSNAERDKALYETYKNMVLKEIVLKKDELTRSIVSGACINNPSIRNIVREIIENEIKDAKIAQNLYSDLNLND